MRVVSDLNTAGLIDTAADALDEAMKRAEAEKEAIHGLQLEQDRVRNDAAGAAARIVKRLRQGDLPKGLFWATYDECRAWVRSGEAEGKTFDLRVALELAKVNQARGRGREKATALLELGDCQTFIGERSSNPGHFRVAENAMREALRLSPRTKIASDWAGSQMGLGLVLWMIGERDKDATRLREAVSALEAALEVFSPTYEPENWATAQDNLGIALETLSEVEGNADHLPRAITAHEAALTVRSPDKGARVWAGSQNNLGIARLRLGAMTRDVAALDAAAKSFGRCLTVWTRDAAPFFWATTRWNLADLAVERYRLSPDATLLATARAHLADAREIFEDGSDHQLERCDELAARIDAAEAA